MKLCTAWRNQKENFFSPSQIARKPTLPSVIGSGWIEKEVTFLYSTALFCAGPSVGYGDG